jgi:hydroxyacylglutathione hydrolase
MIHILKNKTVNYRYIRERKEMDIITIPVLHDNYSYLIIDKETNHAAVVDPVEPDQVINAAKELKVKITCILTTHSHWDHAGGNVELVKKLQESSSSTILVYGGVKDNIPCVTHELGDGQSFKIGTGITVKTIYAPCHTPGHLMYLTQVTGGRGDVQPSALFTGDTLFVAGCGNFNSGTPEQMQNNFERIASLPDDTLIYCGHEYTKGNLQFALYAEPENEDVKEKLRWMTENIISVPSTVGKEKLINPFMRVNEKSIQTFTGTTNPVEGMKRVRHLKDVWGRSHK